MSCEAGQRLTLGVTQIDSFIILCEKNNILYYIIGSFIVYYKINSQPRGYHRLPSAHPSTSPAHPIPALGHLRIKRIPQSSHTTPLISHNSHCQSIHPYLDQKLVLLFSFITSLSLVHILFFFSHTLSTASPFVLHFHLFNAKPPFDTPTCNLTSTRLPRCFMQPTARPSRALMT